ncbi:MAG: patatin-like phospholipase family protein, partial [Nevskiales bacterium]
MAIFSIGAKLRRDQAHAKDYATWYDITRRLESQNGSTEWRDTDASPEYDYALVAHRLDLIRQLRRSGRIKELMHHLRQNLHWNSGNIGSATLYERSVLGTKFLIEDYLDEVATALDFICDNDFEDIAMDQKLRFFRETALSYGRSALMLSGGATMGMFHVGVVKALWEQGLVPEVLSGSSAGSIVAATLGTRQEQDYEDLLSPESLHQEFLRPVTSKQMLQQGAVMNPEILRACLENVLGDLTFEESHQRSGKVVNITIS